EPSRPRPPRSERRECRVYTVELTPTCDGPHSVRGHGLRLAPSERRRSPLMATRASIARHPIHPMLIVFPIGLWGWSLFSDLVYHWGGHNLFWKDMAFYTMAGGFVTALVAAVPGLVDYGTIIDRRVKQIGTSHLVINLVVVALYAVNLWLRRGAPADRSGPVW